MNTPQDNSNIDHLAEQDAASDAAREEEVSEDLEEESAEEGPDYKAVIQALQAEMEQYKDQALRAIAEAENTRKRAQKDKEDARKFAVSSFARDILSVADNLRRALEAVPADLLEAEPRLGNVTQGIEATERELLGAFERNGLTKVEPLHQPFDPNLHEVMFETPSEGHPAGTITQIMEPGYMINGRVLRPARVGIAKDEGQGTGEERPGSGIDIDA